MQWKWKACYMTVSLWLVDTLCVAISYVANPPGHSALFASSRSLVGLALDAWIPSCQLSLLATWAMITEDTHIDP